MLQKIRYRLCHNYGGRLNRQGLAPIAVECSQGNRKIYFSTRVLIRPDQWYKGMVVNHENADKLTAYVIHFRNSIEEIELDALLKGKRMSLYQLKTAVRTGVKSNATLAEFINAVIKDSSRNKTTKNGYKYLANDIEKLYGKVTLEDVTYDFIEKYRNAMRKQDLSENTIKGRLKLLRCVINEAIKRSLITEDPFKFITIGNMTARVGYLEESEVNKIEQLELGGKEAIVRDLFVFACYTGLRWGDLTSLEEAEIKDGILRKMMKKTNHEVIIPIGKLFWGKAQKILDKYPDIKTLSHVCCNTTANRFMKEIVKKAGIKKNAYFHLARKSCSCMLNSLGMSSLDISLILGHTDSAVTEKHYLFNQNAHLQTTVDAIFNNKSNDNETNTEKSS